MRFETDYTGYPALSLAGGACPASPSLVLGDFAAVFPKCSVLAFEPSPNLSVAVRPPPTTRVVRM